MTVDDLLAEAKRNRAGPGEGFSHANLSEFLRIALRCLLEDIDYEADLTSGGAIAARVMAGIIIKADEVEASGEASTLETLDPIFAAIEAHQAAWDLVEAMVESDEDTFSALCRARGDRLAELLATTPTTVAGCAAMLRCVQAATTDSEEDSQLFSDWHERISEPAATLLGRLAGVIEGRTMQ